MMPAGDAQQAELSRRAVSNTLVQFVAPGIRMMFGLALTAALSRYLGVGGFGSYALVFAYVAVFNGVLNDWGLGTICLREICRRTAARPRLIASAATLQAVIALASYLLMVGSLAFLHYPSTVVGGIALYGLSMLLTPLDIVALLFQADLQLARLLAPSLAGVSLNFVLSMAVILLHGPLPALIGVALASLLVQYVWTTLLSLKVLGSRVRPTVLQWGCFVREAWPLGSGAIVSTVLQQAPIIALSVFSLGAAGLFSAANKIPQQLLLIPLAIRGTSFPLLSAAWSTDRGRFVRLVKKLVAGSFLISIPTAVIGIGLAEPLMRVLFGSAFARSAVPFALLLAVFAIMCPGILLGEALTAAGFQRLNFAILSGSLPLLLVLLLVLVPSGGPAGAALALLVCYAAIVAATFAAGNRRLGIDMPLTALALALLGFLLGVGTLYLARPLGPIMSAPVASGVSFATLALFQPTMVRQLWRLTGWPGRAPGDAPTTSSELTVP